MKSFSFFMSFLVSIALCACNDDLDRELYFTGDSIIARWDLAESFPSYICHNDGRSGAGIEYIESLSGAYRGKDVVVMIGTNNSSLMSSQLREEYAQRYVNALMALSARRLYLYSVLPRDFDNDYESINSDISNFNDMVYNLVHNISNIRYLNVYDSFLYNGKPNPQFYSDGLHLSIYGYEILKSALDKDL